MCGVDTLYCEMTLVFHVRPFLFAKRLETETNLMLTLFLLATTAKLYTKLSYMRLVIKQYLSFPKPILDNN